MPRPNPLMDAWYPAPGCTHRPEQTYTRYPCTCGRDLWPPRGRGRGESLYSPRRVRAKLRAIDALKLRSQGFTFQAIADMLGYGSAKSAWRAWRRTLDRVTADEQYKERRRKEGGRPHSRMPSVEEVDYILAQMAEERATDKRMNARRLDTSDKMSRAFQSEAKRRHQE